MLGTQQLRRQPGSLTLAGLQASNELLLDKQTSPSLMAARIRSWCSQHVVQTSFSSRQIQSSQKWLGCGHQASPEASSHPHSPWRQAQRVQGLESHGRFWVETLNPKRVAIGCCWRRWLTPRDQVALTFGGLQEAGVGVELDPQPPRLLGTPFAADLDPGQCYRVFPGGQVMLGARSSYPPPPKPTNLDLATQPAPLPSGHPSCSRLGFGAVLLRLPVMPKGHRPKAKPPLSHTNL